MASEQGGLIPLQRGERRRLPNRRQAYAQKVRVGDQSFYFHTGNFEDGSLGEIFLTAARQGSFTRNMMDALAISVSIGLQYGAPLEEYCDQFINSKFEPSGHVEGDPEIPRAASLLDYVFRRLRLDYLEAPNPADGDD